MAHQGHHPRLGLSDTRLALNSPKFCFQLYLEFYYAFMYYLVLVRSTLIQIPRLLPATE
jgi:hypothetical protein